MPYDRQAMNVRTQEPRQSDHERATGAGQSLAEYALIVALIVIVALVALTLFGTQINDILSIIAHQING